jgi:glycerol-3-phosphate acyltransferase PlsX
MSIGEEEEKGNSVTIAAHQLLKETAEINFIGNLEGRDLFNDKADVVVCDGFTGNIMLKEAEAFYEIISKKISDPYFERFNYEAIGGAPVLGVNGNVIIAHGISKAPAVKSMISLAYEVMVARLNERIEQALGQVVQQS